MGYWRIVGIFIDNSAYRGDHEDTSRDFHSEVSSIKIDMQI